MNYTETPALQNAFLNGAKAHFKRLLLRTSGSTPFASSSNSGSAAPLLSTSASRSSWSNPIHSLSRSEDRIDINARDSLGRTILHLVAYSLDPSSLDYLRLLLDTQPKSGINLNLQDVESGWTALHRALWVGNLAGARMLLGEERVDLGVKDKEGLTAWDLYNSTVEGTNPPEDSSIGETLFTWGSNRNHTLGQGSGDDSHDRSLPDKVTLRRVEKPVYEREDVEEEGGEERRKERGDLRRFDTVNVREVRMGRFHTAVVTAEPSNNVNLCGHGSGGRLARSVHSQPDLLPIPDFPHTIVSLALGQDHTLALSNHGHILSWGTNRFSVLGYQVDTPTSGGGKFSSGPEEPIQTTPRRIVGSLKKEEVLGVAASRCSSACWTSEAVWTWGYNNGHLGYDVASNPVQALPRKIAALSQPVIGLALTDYALVCLLATNEVLCFYRGGSTKVNFPTSPFFAESAIYRPPEFRKRSEVVKVTASGITFACLTSLGDVFTFALASPTEVERDAAASGGGSRGGGVQIKPQRAWALRKKFTAVKDVALGSDGGIILATQSGHVFVRTRNTKSSTSSSKAFKFQRIPFLQRIIKVSANESGAFAAIRADAVPKTIDLEGPSVGEDLTYLLPHVRRWMEGRKGSFLLAESETHVDPTEEEGESESASVKSDIKIARQLVQISDQWKPSSSYPPLFGVAGSDCVFHAAGRDTPAHQVIVATRSSVLRRLLSGEKIPSCRVSLERTPEGLVRLHLPKSDHLTVLLLLQYLYSDDLPAVWDPRVGRELQDSTLSNRNINLVAVRNELKLLAETLDLPALSMILQLSSKTIPTPSLSSDLYQSFEIAQSLLQSSSSSSPSTSPLRPDVLIELSDRTVAAHESILRSRSPFFSALFDDSEWTSNRRDPSNGGRGTVTVNLRHLPWSTMKPVFRFLYEDVGTELFDYHHQDTIDSFLDFVFEVLAAANELLLDKLTLLCSSVVLRHVTTLNSVSLLSDASFYHADDLKASLQGYIARNMETMLESHLLDSMAADTLAELSEFVVGKQGERLPISRSGVLVTAAMERNREWLRLEDFPKLTLRSTKAQQQQQQQQQSISRSPKLSPSPSPAPAEHKSLPRRTSSYSVPISPLTSPAMHAQVGGEEVDEGLFAMDEEVDEGLAKGLANSLAIGARAKDSSSKPVWKSRAVEAERTDLRSIMAGEASSSRPRLPSLPSTRAPSDAAFPSPTFKLSQKDRKKLNHSSTSSPILRATITPPSSLPSTPWRLPSTTSSTTSTPAQPHPSPPPATIFPSLRGFPSPAAASTSSPRRDSLPSLMMARAGSSTGPGTHRGGPPVTPSSIFGSPSSTNPANASRNVIVPTPRVVSSSSIHSTYSSSTKPTSTSTSSSATWSIPTFTAPPPPPPPSSSPATSSFAHIQQQQRIDKQVEIETTQKGSMKKTLMEIQKEEQEVRRAEKEEVDFLLWWAEEEKRIKKEEWEVERRMVEAMNGGGGGSGRGGGGKRGGKSGTGGGGGGGKKKGGGSGAAVAAGGGEASSSSTPSPAPQPSTRGGGGGGRSKGSTTGGGGAVTRGSRGGASNAPGSSTGGAAAAGSGAGAGAGGGGGNPLNPATPSFVLGA